MPARVRVRARGWKVGGRATRVAELVRRRCFQLSFRSLALIRARLVARERPGLASINRGVLFLMPRQRGPITTFGKFIDAPLRRHKVPVIRQVRR